MKITKPAFQKPNDVITAKAEQMLLDKLPVDQKTLQRAAGILEPKNLKWIGLAVIGGSALVTIASSISHDAIYKAMVAKEMKKQIKPLEQKLDELREQNEILLRQNRELADQLKKLQAEE